MSKFLHANDNNDTMAIAIPPVFFENSQANNSKNMRARVMVLVQDTSSNGALLMCSIYHSNMTCQFGCIHTVQRKYSLIYSKRK